MPTDTLRNVLTRDGELKPVHLRAWADHLEEGLGYKGASLPMWLREVADALAAIPDEPEMVAVLKHLKRLEVMHHQSHDKFKAKGWEDLALAASSCEADYKALIDWIWLKFGYKLEEE